MLHGEGLFQMLGNVLQFRLHSEVVSLFLCVRAEEALILFHLLLLRLCLTLNKLVRVELGTLLATV